MFPLKGKNGTEIYGTTGSIQLTYIITFIVHKYP